MQNPQNSSYEDLWNRLALFRGLRAASGFAMRQSNEALAAKIYALGGDFGLALRTLVLDDENLCVKRPELFRQEGPLRAQLEYELDALSALSARARSEYPQWPSTPQDFRRLYFDFLEHLSQTGFGIYARNHMFTLEESGTLRPVLFSDPQRLSSLYGYERQRQPVLDNTLALLAGRPAQHVLLYGDAGTGKSSTIKAIANEYQTQGLRLIEVPKHALRALPQLLETLGENPLKFLIFIDDLSFAQADDNFTALKAVLEGGAGGYAQNYAIYATGNRRHLVKERMEDRAGDDIHINDSLQETLSLSARFGLTITFQNPGKEEYIAIVKQLARERGLAMEEGQLAEHAECQALRRNGRTPRLAKQLVDALLAQQPA